MTKRKAKRSAAKPRAKKTRTDPVLATLANAIFRECQKQSLSSRTSLLEADVAAEDAKLENLRASHAELVKMITVEEAGLVALREEGAVSIAKRSLADATAIVNARGNALSRQQVAQKASQRDLAHAEAEKVTLEGASKEFSFMPVTLDFAGQPEGMTLSLEIRDDSWLRAFPESGSHAEAARYKPFLEGLEKAISSDMSLLGAAAAAETLVSGERNAAVQAAEEEYENSKAAEKNAAADLDVVEKAIVDREVTLSKSRQAIVEYVVQMDAARVSLDKARMNLKAFQDGPVAKFMACESVASATLHSAAPSQARSSVSDKENSAPAAAIGHKEGPLAEQQQRRAQHGLVERPC